MSLTQTNKPSRKYLFVMKVVLLVFILIFGGVIGFNAFKSIMTAKYLANMPETASPVTAMTVEPKEWTPVIGATGLVRPNQGAMLSIQTSGTISKILVQNGQMVKKGDVLVELDSSVERANLHAAEAQLPYLRQTYQRYANLVKSDAASKADYDSAKASYDAQVASIEALKSTIERMKVVAPFSGKAGIVQVNEGQYVSSATNIVRVEDTSSMKVDFSIAQNLVSKLFIGQKIIATSDAVPNETFTATITAIEPAVNSSTGLVDVQATFDANSSKHLLSGMFTRLKVQLPVETNQIVVPQVAITYNMYGEVAYLLTALSDEDKSKLEGNEKLDHMYRAKQITVFTKDRQGVNAQLKGDEVKVGDKIIIGGQQSISNGSLVEVVDKEPVGTKEPETKTNL